MADSIQGTPVAKIQGIVPYLNPQVVPFQRPGADSPSFSFMGFVSQQTDLIVTQMFNDITAYGTFISDLRELIGSNITIVQHNATHSNLRLLDVIPLPESVTIGLAVGVLGSKTVTASVRIIVMRANN